MLWTLASTVHTTGINWESVGVIVGIVGGIFGVVAALCSTFFRYVSNQISSAITSAIDRLRIDVIQQLDTRLSKLEALAQYTRDRQDSYDDDEQNKQNSDH